jgi:hypothetical protein
MAWALGEPGWSQSPVRKIYIDLSIHRGLERVTNREKLCEA